MTGLADRQERLLDEAAAAERAMWTRGGPGLKQRRNQAVAAAVADGWTVEEIADALRVLPDDVRRWAAARTPGSL